MPDITRDDSQKAESGESTFPAGGLFLSHIRSPRIERHFERLARETEGLVEWHFISDTAEDAARRAAPWMPDRQARMLRNGGVQGGYMDTVIVPRALDLGPRFVWALEYDVDYSGDWRRFFEQFAASDADLLTSTITSRQETPRWRHWRTASSPAPRRDDYRAFHPVMRLSRRLLETYVARIGEPGWEGHYEYILPTLAVAAGLTLEDLGGTSRFCPPERKGRNYRNTPADRKLAPGTFVWRPAMPFYFHERPELFPEPDMLHHPVKPAVTNWETIGRWWRGFRTGRFAGVPALLRGR